VEGSAAAHTETAATTVEAAKATTVKAATAAVETTAAASAAERQRIGRYAGGHNGRARQKYHGDSAQTEMS
jgi:hypothetical protein